MKRLLLIAILFCIAAVPSYAQDPEPTPRQESTEREEPTADAPSVTSGLFVRAFGTVNWGASNANVTPNSFAVGDFALFITSAVTERVSVLAEIVMETSRNTNVVTDLERLQLTFSPNDLLRVSAGRYSTGIGFYNSAFHHGEYFETAIGHPRVFGFEDEGGVLPVHEVGVSAGGSIPGTGSAVHYLAEVGNGRGWNTRGRDIEAALDTNAAKSINVGVSIAPARWRGLAVGTSFYRDRIPYTGPGAVAHRIGAAFLVYRAPSIEIMAEWLRVSHHIEEGLRFTNPAGYIQASKAWGKVRPYYRYDRLMVDPATPFIGYAGSYSANIVGVRVNPGRKVGLKAQYKYRNETQHRGIDAVRTQLVFVF